MLYKHNSSIIDGVLPGKLKPKDNESTLGFCKDNQKWYGWRINGEMRGFGVGSINKKEYNIPSHFGIPDGYRAMTLDEAKRMAIAFADSR